MQSPVSIARYQSSAMFVFSPVAVRTVVIATRFNATSRQRPACLQMSLCQYGANVMRSCGVPVMVGNPVPLWVRFGSASVSPAFSSEVSTDAPVARSQARHGVFPCLNASQGHLRHGRSVCGNGLTAFVHGVSTRTWGDPCMGVPRLHGSSVSSGLCSLECAGGRNTLFSPVRCMRPVIRPWGFHASMGYSFASCGDKGCSRCHGVSMLL